MVNAASHSRQVLVVGPSWVGDMMMAQALFLRLAEREPGIAIDVLAPAWSAGLLGRMPQVRRCIPAPFAHGQWAYGERRSLGHSLRAVGYQQAIVLPGSWKAALVPYFAQIPRRTGFRREWRYGLLNDMRLLQAAALPTTVEQYVALGEAAGAPVGEIPMPRLRTDNKQAAALCERLGLDFRGPVVALVPGAEYGPAKRWPSASFATLARALVARGAHCWIFGSERERALGEDILRAAGEGVTNLCGRTQLEDVVDLLSRCWVAVSNDSGLMHVAAAVGIPVVAVFGSSSPTHTPPLTAAKTIHYLNLACSPCFKRECPLGHTHCLNWIQPSDVLASTVRAGTL